MTISRSVLPIVFLFTSVVGWTQSDTVVFSIQKRQGLSVWPDVDYLVGGLDNYLTIKISEGMAITDTLVDNAMYSTQAGRLKLTPLSAAAVRLEVFAYDSLGKEQVKFQRSYRIAPCPVFTINGIAQDSAVNYFEFLYAAKPVILDRGLDMKVEVVSFDIEFVAYGKLVALSSDDGTMNKEIKGALLELAQPTEVLFSGIKALINDKIEVKLSPYRVYLIPQNEKPLQWSTGPGK